MVKEEEKDISDAIQILQKKFGVDNIDYQKDYHTIKFHRRLLDSEHLSVPADDFFDAVKQISGIQTPDIWLMSKIYPEYFMGMDSRKLTAEIASNIASRLEDKINENYSIDLDARPTKSDDSISTIITNNRPLEDNFPEGFKWLQHIFGCGNVSSQEITHKGEKELKYYLRQGIIKRFHDNNPNIPKEYLLILLVNALNSNDALRNSGCLEVIVSKNPRGKDIRFDAEKLNNESSNVFRDEIPDFDALAKSMETEYLKGCQSGKYVALKKIDEEDMAWRRKFSKEILPYTQRANLER